MVDSKKTRKEPVEKIQALWRAQEELRKGEEIYRAFFVTNPDGIIVCDMEGKLLDANKAFVDMLGYTIEELRGKTYKQITPRKWHKTEANIVKNQILAKGFSEAYEKEYIRKDGSVLPVAVRINTTKNRQGRPVIVWSFIIRDITERNKAEKQIESLARFPSENPYPILRVAENGEILYSNKAGLRILSKWKSGVGKAVPERWKHLIAEVLKSGKSRIQEEVSGEIFSFVISPVIDAGYVNLYARDTTEQKRTEKVLRFSLNFLERANLKTSKASLLEEFVKEIQEFTDCEAVGIRILDESGNIPYEAYAGFSKEFYELENSLSVKSDKCMCINVIRGQTDSKLPFYTEGGSFYMNGMARFLATVSEEDKGQNRHLCNEFGYESVALVPIRLRNALIGLIHVADSRENMVPLYLVEMLEKITTQVTSVAFRSLTARIYVFGF